MKTKKKWFLTKTQTCNQQSFDSWHKNFAKNSEQLVAFPRDPKIKKHEI